MATITEDYVSFETAKLLKEKGFDIETIKYWENEGGPTTIPSICELSEPYSNSYLGTHEYSCPSQSMAMKWLRVVHKLYVNILYSEYLYGNKPFYWYIECLNEKPVAKRIVNTSTATEYTYRTYEEATEAAINYCIENLI